MTPPRRSQKDSLAPALLEQIDCLCDRFEDEWKSGGGPRIEDYLAGMQEPGQAALLESLVALECDLRRRQGEAPTIDEYRTRFSEHAELITRIFSGDTSQAPPGETGDWTTETGDRLAATGDWAELPNDAAAPTVRSLEPSPGKTLGRYELREILGKGGFGTVYLAHDADLDRPVAIKFLDAKRLPSEHAFETLQSEARTLARLKHPAIVAVYDVGRDEGGICYMVMEYIAGRSLIDWMDRQRLGLRQAATGIATVAEAVYHAHRQGLVHRDLKPGNILIDEEGGFHVADFGLAVHEDAQRWLAGELGGTPSYMAPEQVRAETHRLDGRTDVWGLGVVLYQLLTLRCPFKAERHDELFDQIRYRDPEPPRQIDPTIPEELQRVCLKCLAKRMTDRYRTAAELAADLRHWAQTQGDVALGESRREVVSAPHRPSGGPRPEPRELKARPVKIVPRGLRAFSTQDKDFFLDLLSGPRERNGLPACIQFWKSRLEDLEDGHGCSLIYGPSGCGKSSLVRAGLLPRLADHVVPVYVEAVPDATETRLLKELRKQCPQLTEDLNLAQSFVSLRAGRIAWPDRKVLVVLDQFEQWLHAHRPEEGGPLVDALRQCDGKRLACVLMVRDDFWLAITRFLQALEIQVIEGKNIALVDLFDPRHAKKVLAHFGQAYGCLPEDLSALTTPQEKFLDRAVAGLTEDGKVIPVRLSLFAEMVKAKPWSPATLDEVGGMEGLGVAFLEESFGSRTANPQHRLHQEAARAVFGALLPDHAAEIKGCIRAHGELLAVSGYADRPGRFDDLLRILDAELRLVTPTDLEGQEETGDDLALALPGERYYQLSHDYLVRSLREWLTRKQKETRRGRARLCLEERTAQWKPTGDKRFLPSPLEYLAIRAGVPKRTQNPDQRKVMRAATRRYGTMTLLWAALIAVLGWGTWEINGRFQSRRVTEKILVAEPSDLEDLIDNQLPPYRRWANPRLRDVAEDKSSHPDKRWRAGLALVVIDKEPADLLREKVLVDFLYGRLFDCRLDDFPPIRDGLAPYKARLVRGLWQTFHDAGGQSDARFRAGLSLATYAPQAAQWSDADVAFLAARLVESNLDDQRDLRTHLKPITARLSNALEAIFHDRQQTETARTAAAAALVDLAADSPERLAGLAADAIAPQYGLLYPALAASSANREKATRRLRQILAAPAGKTDSPTQRMRLACRRAGAAITLVRLKAPQDALRVLRVREDPEQATQFVHRLEDRGVTAGDLATCLEAAKDASSRYALLLGLGEFAVDELPASARARLTQTLLDWYRDDGDCGVHGACGWLLRRWGFARQVEAVDRTPQPFDPSGKRTWFVQNLGNGFLTFIVFPPGDFIMGSPESEQNHQKDETQHPVRITRPFAVCDREVTREQFETYVRDASKRPLVNEEFAPTGDHPVVGVRWYDAVSYCRWLTTQAGMSEDDQCYNDPGQWKPLPGRFFGNVEFHPERPGFRLPTEAEWEYACRCGTTTAYSFGTDRTLLGRYAWFEDNSHGQTQLPAGLRPNPRGLFDMHGNALEWCHDRYGRYTGRDDPDVIRREGVSQDRVVRGGDWSSAAKESRCALRHRESPVIGGSVHGLRVVQTVGQAAEGR